MTVPRGLLTGTVEAMALVWGLYAVVPGGSLAFSVALTAGYAGLLVLTTVSRSAKVLLVRAVQRWIINPLVRVLFAAGVNPLGLAILETRGWRSGKPRRARSPRQERQCRKPERGPESRVMITRAATEAQRNSGQPPPL